MRNGLWQGGVKKIDGRKFTDAAELKKLLLADLDKWLNDGGVSLGQAAVAGYTVLERRGQLQ